MSSASNNTETKASKRYKKKSQAAMVWHNFKKNKGALIGVAVILVIIIAMFVTMAMVDYKQVTSLNAKERLLLPSSQHLFGTDQFGRDVFFVYFMS